VSKVSCLGQALNDEGEKQGTVTENRRF